MAKAQGQVRTSRLTKERSRRGVKGTVSLRDLIAPLRKTQFIRDYLLAGQHYLSRANPRLVRQLAALEVFKEFGQFVGRLDRVDLFGADGFRSSVPGRVALDFYKRGDTLYISRLEQSLPAARELCGPVATSLGVDPRQLSVEIFAGRNRGVSSLHYDHDTNFHILLSGKKRWRLQRNRHILYPLFPNQNLKSPREEALAERLPFPTHVTDLDDPVSVIATPGTCLFLPVGCWHEVEMLDDCVAVNISLQATRWLDAVASAVRRALVSNPELRRPVFGARLNDGSMLQRDARLHLDTAVEAVAIAVRAVSLDDIGLAAEQPTMRWRSETNGRKLEKTARGIRFVCADMHRNDVPVDAAIASLLRKMFGLSGWFTLEDLKALAPTIPTRSILEFMTSMKERGYFEGHR
jgi:hypothetical protein